MMRPIFPSIIAVAIGGLAAALWWQGQAPRISQTRVTTSVPVGAPSTSEVSQSIVDLPAVSEKKLTETASRPLFAASRRREQYIEPAPEPEFETPPDEETYVEDIIVEVDTPAPSPPTMLIMSGFMADDKGPRALIRNEVAQTEKWLSVGSVVDGWKVVSITSQDVTVAREGSKFVVKLYE